MTSKILSTSIAALFASVLTTTSIAADLAEAAADAKAAAADTAAEAATGAFSSLDANADGMISAEEAQSNPALMESWSSVDKNADGQLDASEFSAFETGAEGEAAPAE